MARDVRGPLKVGKEQIKDLLKVASRPVVVIQDKSVLQEMSFSSETDGNCQLLVQQRKRVEVLAFGLHGIHAGATQLMIKGTDLSTHTYAAEGGRESNQFLAYSKWDELCPLQLGMEDDTVNLIGVQRGLGDIQLMARTTTEGFLL